VIKRLRRRNDDHAPVLATPWATRLLRYGLWTLVAVGALGGLVAAVRPSTTVVQQAAHQADAEPSGLRGVAELAVRDWLLHEGRPAPGSSDTLTVDAVATVATRRVTSDYWAATVAASVRPADTPAATVWFLEVGITETDHGPRPVGRPAIVPAPVTLTAAEPASLTLTVPHPGDPVATTAEAFLRALLTGAGDAIRYVAPDVDIAPIEDAPFTAVRLERIAVIETEPDTSRVRVSISGTTDQQIVFDLVYELTLHERDGRWEIAAMNGAPSPAAARPQRSSTTTTPASTTTTGAASPGA
jgi:hypothetical protein